MEQCPYAKQESAQGIVSLWAHRGCLRHLYPANWPQVGFFHITVWSDMRLLMGDSAELYQEAWSRVGSRTSELVLNIELAGVANTRLKLRNYSCWVTCCVYLSISRTLPATLLRGTVGGFSPPCFYGGSRNRLWAQAKVVLRMPDWFLLPSLLLAACLLLFIVTYLHIVFSPCYRWGNSTDNSSRAQQVPESEHSSPPFVLWKKEDWKCAYVFV